MKSNPVTEEEGCFIRDCLQYDAVEGVVSWRVEIGRGKSKRYPGSVAGCVLTDKYLQIKIGGRKYLAHRIAWFLHYGEWPALEVDHINGVRSDNRITNLRQATRSQNKQNERLRDGNKSGFKGVYFCKTRKKWRGYAAVDGKRTDAGYFETAQEAGKAAEDIRNQLHGEFSRST